jgi:hypothetical protein
MIGGTTLSLTLNNDVVDDTDTIDDTVDVVDDTAGVNESSLSDMSQIIYFFNGQNE